MPSPLRLCALRLCALLATALALRAVPPEIKLDPVIGILTVPIDSPGSPCATLALPSSTSPHASCAQTFYVKWLESAGARAVFIPYDADDATLTALLDGVNGVLFTGGGLENLTFNTPYMVAASKVFNAVKKKNDAGVFYPLHGTCEGLQVLSLLASMNQSVVIDNAFDSENLMLPLDISWDGHHSSRIFDVDTAPGDIIDTLMTKNVTVNMHHDGVPVDVFEQNPALSSFFILVSTNFDRQGKSFVSTIESWAFPITATQWHPEKPAFEFRSTNNMNTSHISSGIEAMQYMANFFVKDARRNAQSFAPGDPLFASLSAFKTPIVGAADVATSGYSWCDEALPPGIRRRVTT